MSTQPERAISHQLDLAWVREQFPSLKQSVNGHPVIFLDGPGGTQVPRQVIDAVSRHYERDNANDGGAFATSRRAETVVAEAHAAMADLLGCDAEEVVFGLNMTSLTFDLSHAMARELKAGDEVVVTLLNHDASVAPWQALEERGVVVRMAGIREPDCTLDMQHLASLINHRTRLVSVVYACNAVGNIVDVGEVVRLARKVGALTFIDAVHYPPHGAVDVRALDCDFLACSPYKFFAPHLGALYGKREHLTRLRPYKVSAASEKLPGRWETGTPNFEGQAGLIAAIEYLAEIGRRCNPEADGRRAALESAYQAIQVQERRLLTRLVAGLLTIPGLRLYGIADPARFDERVATVALRIEGHTPLELATRLAERGIFTWNGSFYAIHLAERLGLQSSGGLLRMGLVHYNTIEEVDRVVTELKSIAA